MSDLISRQAAIDVLSVGKELLSRVLDDIDVVGADRDKYSWGLGLIESNIEDIKELPPAQPGVQWIPCSERLPDALDSVLVTSTGGHVYISYIVHGEFEYGGEVIAWMPLPKPYEVKE